MPPASSGAQMPSELSRQGAEFVYCGGGTLPGSWWLAWTTEPALWAFIIAWGALTAIALPRQRSAWLAWAAAALIFLSPLCALGVNFFSGRVVHHILLLSVVAPLLAHAWTQARKAQRARSAADLPADTLPPQRLARPGMAAAVLAAVFWFWHSPQAYGFALQTATGYWLLQVSLVGSAVWFWRDTVWPGRSSSSTRLVAVLALLATAAQMGLLGALITFATGLLYPQHVPGLLAWGWEPRADQQLGGLLMWVPATVPFLVAGLTLTWLSATGQAGQAVVARHAPTAASRS